MPLALYCFMVMEIISRKINTKDILRKKMYADDLAIIAESKQDLQEVLEEWKGVFKKHGLRMSLEKTEVMWIGHQREELNIRLDGKEIKQVDGFVYLGGMVTEDGHSAAEVRRRTQAGANAWRKVEGVMLDRNISKKLKGKVLRTCVTPACQYDLVALTEQQQQKLQVCENNWVRRITRTKKVDRRRMNDLRREVGMQCSLTGRLVRSRMRWAGHLVRMDASKLAKRAEVEKHQGRRKRPQLRWEDCVRRDMRRSVEDERWREGRPTENYGKKEQKEWLDNTLPDPHHCTAGNKEEEHTLSRFLYF